MKINDAKTIREMDQAVGDTLTRTGEHALLNALDLVSKYIDLTPKQFNLAGILRRRYQKKENIEYVKCSKCGSKNSHGNYDNYPYVECKCQNCGHLWSENMEFENK